MKWVLGSIRLPEVGQSVFCRKSYYADKSATGKTVFTIGSRNKHGELSVIERWPANWEWLDEDECPPTQIKMQHPIKRTQKNFFLPTDICCYCDRPFREGLEATKEHIVPKSKGGTGKLKNLKPCCFECNQLKSNLDLSQFKTTVWNIIKILNGRYSLSLEDLKTVYENLRSV